MGHELHIARNCRGDVPQTSRRWCGPLRLSLTGRAAKNTCQQLFHALAGRRQGRGAFLVPTQWTAACTSCTQPSQLGLYSRVLHQRSSGSDTCPASRISLRHRGAVIGSSYSSLDGARLLGREDAGKDTTAASEGAGKASSWLVPASNEDQESRTDRFAAIAGRCGAREKHRIWLLRDGYRRGTSRSYRNRSEGRPPAGRHVWWLLYRRRFGSA
jgi:hypothetical protein